MCSSIYLFIFLCGFGLAQSDDKVVPDENKDSSNTTLNYGVVIGIDLGTTYSCVGIFKEGRVEIIPNDQGNRITPSYIAFTADGERLIGDSAKNQLTDNPVNTIFDIKRLIGREWSDRSVQSDIKHYPFRVVNIENKPHVRVTVGQEVKDFQPEEISAMILSKMKIIAEEYLGQKVTHAVVTVPAYFNDAQRQATKNAGTIAGLTVLRIINEPTAAAIAYGLDKKAKTEQKEHQILVFDLGGGTFDVSLLTIDQGVFEVVATNGNTHLGGEDFDQRVIDYMVQLYKKKKNKDIKKDIRAIQKLRREVEKAKRSLSNVMTARIEIESIMDGEDFSESLTRAKFEELNIDLFKSTLVPVQKVLEDAGLLRKDIAEIVMVGGSTRIPKVQELVKEFFNGKELNKGINPDEAVAYGAAVQAGVLSGDKTTGDLLLLDVCPLTLGMELEGGFMAKLINRNTPIPTIKKDIYTTVVDNQYSVTTSVYEGERPMVKDNHFLGQFDLTGIPPAPRGIPQIEVTFEIDVNGILKVTSEDKGSGNKQHIVISNDKNRLKPEEIDKMIQDAEKYREQDEAVRERIVAFTNLEQYVYSLKFQLNDENQLAKKVSEEDLQKANEALGRTIQWLENNRNASLSELEIERKLAEKVLIPIIAKVYVVNMSAEMERNKTMEAFDKEMEKSAGEEKAGEGGAKKVEL